MKILYAIQGTGNGHISRARDIVPLLKEKAEVDLLVSGTQAEVDLPYPITYRCKGMGFVFGKKGGVDISETYKSTNLKQLRKEINALPVEKYDLVIDDFEPVAAWACYKKNKQCIALSHQSAVLNKNAPQPKRTDPLGRAILKHYAPADLHYGFHFQPYDKNIFTPVIRREVRQMPTENLGHYTVYLPAYDDKRIIKMLSRFENASWQVFSKHNKQPIKEKNISILPINNESFIKSLATSTGVLCGAGFETPAEALFMKKKLLVIPMKNQYEQHCNAAALKAMGVPVVKSFKKKHADKIQAWLDDDTVIQVDYPDITDAIIDQLLSQAAQPNQPVIDHTKQPASKKTRDLSLRKIVTHLVK